MTGVQTCALPISGALAAVNTVADNIADVNTVADNINDVTNFADVYYGPSATPPGARRDGSPLQTGDLYYNTDAGGMFSFDGARWAPATSIVSVFTQTFSGDGKETSFALPFAPASEGNTQIYISGVYQQKGLYEVEYNVITFSEPPPVGTDNIEVVVLPVAEYTPATLRFPLDLGFVTEAYLSAQYDLGGL